MNRRRALVKVRETEPREQSKDCCSQTACCCSSCCCCWCRYHRRRQRPRRRALAFSEGAAPNRACGYVPAGAGAGVRVRVRLQMLVLEVRKYLHQGALQKGGGGSGRGT